MAYTQDAVCSLVVDPRGSPMCNRFLSANRLWQGQVHSNCEMIICVG